MFLIQAGNYGIFFCIFEATHDPKIPIQIPWFFVHIICRGFKSVPTQFLEPSLRDPVWTGFIKPSVSQTDLCFFQDQTVDETRVSSKSKARNSDLHLKNWQTLNKGVVDKLPFHPDTLLMCWTTQQHQSFCWCSSQVSRKGWSVSL